MVNLSEVRRDGEEHITFKTTQQLFYRENEEKVEESD